MNLVEWLVYAAACAYRADPDHWLFQQSEPMCAALDIIAHVNGGFVPSWPPRVASIDWTKFT